MLLSGGGETETSPGSFLSAMEGISLLHSLCRLCQTQDTTASLRWQRSTTTPTRKVASCMYRVHHSVKQEHGYKKQSYPSHSQSIPTSILSSKLGSSLNSRNVASAINRNNLTPPSTYHLNRRNSAHNTRITRDSRNTIPTSHNANGSQTTRVSPSPATRFSMRCSTSSLQLLFLLLPSLLFLLLPNLSTASVCINRFSCETGEEVSVYDGS